MTDYTYDDFDDAAECILGAAEDLAASDAAFEDEIPIAQDDDRSYASTESEDSKLPDTRRMADISDSLYNDVNPLIGPLDGTGLLCKKCGGTFAKVTSKSTKQTRNAVLRQWAAFVAGAPEDGLDSSAPFFLTRVDGEVTKVSRRIWSRTEIAS